MWGESLTEEYRAIGLFTDRGAAIRRFMNDYIQADPPRDTILFVQGDGGHGKTLLLRYLREHCCKRFDGRVWTGLLRLDDEPLKARVSHPSDADGTPCDVPSCLIDFGAAGLDYRPQDPYEVLLKLHRELAPHGLHFPLYDAGVLNYLEKTRQASAAQIESIFPATEMDFVAELANVAAHAIPYYNFFKALVGVADRHGRQRIKTYLERRNVPLQRLEEIQRMDPERDLLPRLPALFAEDLRAAMALDNAPPRVVLFFDTHEAFWGQDHLDSDDRYFQLDEWLRRLLAPLVARPSGVAIVVAGRDAPRWPEAGVCPIPAAAIDLYPLGGLGEADARGFLQQPGVAITDSGLQQSLLEYARLGTNEIHPLHLGLLADIVLAAREKGEQLMAQDFTTVPDLAQKNRDLLRRLLRRVDADLATAVRALSVCRGFNRDIYFILADGLRYSASHARFEAPIRLSFVRSVAEQGAGWYRFHDLMRRLIREQDRTITYEANLIMERYYRARAQDDPTTIAEAIYHANRVDMQRGLQEWYEEMEAALQRSRYNLCRALLGVLPHLAIDSDRWRGDMARLEANYFAVLAQYQAAQAGYSAAIIAYDAALTLAPNDVEILNNKGNALARRGDLEVRLAQHVAARASYSEAVSAYNAVLACAPGYVGVLNNKGTALASRGYVEMQLAQYEMAQASYTDAISAYDAVIALAPDDLDALNNKGFALQRRGDLEAQLAQHEAAEATYTAAVATFDAAFGSAPNDVGILNNKGLALQNWGDLEIQLAQHVAAQASYIAAIAAYDAALAVAPNYVDALNNKGNALQRRGDLEVQLAQHQAAQATYSEAIAAYDAVLARAPENVGILNNKGNALQRRGDLAVQLAQPEVYQASYSAAINAYDAALALAPDYLDALNNKGLALQSRGDLEATSGNQAEARGCWRGAICRIRDKNGTDEVRKPG
jgi:tetratricopeptide (TPR) repeat protein